LYFVTLSVKIEQQLLQDPRSTVLVLTPLALAALGLRAWTALANSGDGEDELKFEERAFACHPGIGNPRLTL
jgi:hypothetical protein